MLLIFLKVFVVIVGITWVGGIAYMISKGKIFKRFYHNIMRWHLPSDEPQEFDGCNTHAKCKICGKTLCRIVKATGFKL